jgi:hypothetical protein
MGQQLLLAKTEVTKNTEAVATAADACFVENVQWKTNGTKVQINVAKPSNSADPRTIHGEHVEVTFDFLLAGSGVAGTAPKCGRFLTSSGYAEATAAGAVTYSRLPDEDTSKSLTMVWRDQGRLHKGLGMKGKIDIKAIAGEPLRGSALYRGIMVPLTAGAALVAADADFTGWQMSPTIAQERTTFTLGGVALTLRELAANHADNVKFINLVGQKGAFLKGDASLTGSIKANTPAIGTYNPETKWRQGSIEPWSLIHGTEAGNIVTLNGLVQLDKPDWSQVDGFDVFTSGADFVGSTLQASDDFSIVFA